MAEPVTALEHLRGLIVIDEVQRHPDLFLILRLLLDRKLIRARFLILGSASPELLRQSSETLAGWLAVVEMAGFTLDELSRPDPIIIAGLICRMEGKVLKPLNYADTQGAFMHSPGRWQKYFIGLLLAAAMSAGASTRSGSCNEDPAGAEADKKQILNLISGMQEAWNRGDFRGYMQGFKNPGVVFVSGGRFQAGWQGTLDHYIRDYSGSSGTLRFYDIQVEMLAPDAAQLISRFELIRPQHPQYGINTRLMRKVNGQWVIALNHVSASETPPSTSTASTDPGR